MVIAQPAPIIAPSYLPCLDDEKIYVDGKFGSQTFVICIRPLARTRTRA